MLARILTVVLLCCATWFIGPGQSQSIVVLDTQSSRCLAAKNFLARTALTGSDVNNYSSLICGLVADGVITGNLSGATDCGSHLDVFYIFATANTTEALKNICGTSFSGTANGAPSFTAYQGYTGVDNSTTVFIDTGFNSSTAGGAFTQNAAHASAWSNSNRTPAAFSGALIGSAANFGNPTSSAVQPKNSTGTFDVEINDSSTPAGAAGPASTLGWFLVNRTGVSASCGYVNGVSFSCPNATSGTLQNNNFYVLGQNNGGTADGLGHQVTMASLGGDLVTAGLHTAFYNRVRAYMTAVGVP